MPFLTAQVNLLTCSPHCPCNAEWQKGRLWIPIKRSLYELIRFTLEWMVYFKADRNYPKRHAQCKHVLTLTQCISWLHDDTLGIFAYTLKWTIHCNKMAAWKRLAPFKVIGLALCRNKPKPKGPEVDASSTQPSELFKLWAIIFFLRLKTVLILTNFKSKCLMFCCKRMSLYVGKNLNQTFSKSWKTSCKCALAKG